MVEFLLPPVIGVAVGLMGNFVHERIPAVNLFNSRRTNLHMRETIMAAEIAGIAISGSQKDYAACVAFFSAFLTTFFSESHYEPNISTD